MSDLFIPVIQGTTRKDRKSIFVSRFIVSVLEQTEGVRTELVDPVDLKLPYDGNDEISKDPRYTKLTQEADAFFFVVPEYNHSFPGSLKRVLDSELQTYNHKAAAFAGVSSGQFGGVRAIEHMVGAVREGGLVALAIDVQFPNVQDLFEENGTIKDPETYTRRVRRVLKELIWMAKTLKWGRENL
jgi:NAD(P)H-dependent FMN reductase